MTSKNKTSQPDNLSAAEDTSSDEKSLDAQAIEATDPIAADMAAANEDYIMEIVSRLQMKVLMKTMRTAQLTWRKS